MHTYTYAVNYAPNNLVETRMLARLHAYADAFIQAITHTRKHKTNADTVT